MESAAGEGPTKNKPAKHLASIRENPIEQPDEFHIKRISTENSTQCPHICAACKPKNVNWNHPLSNILNASQIRLAEVQSKIAALEEETQVEIGIGLDEDEDKDEQKIDDMMEKVLDLMLLLEQRNEEIASMKDKRKNIKNKSVDTNCYDDLDVLKIENQLLKQEAANMQNTIHKCSSIKPPIETRSSFLGWRTTQTQPDVEKEALRSENNILKEHCIELQDQIKKFSSSKSAMELNRSSWKK